MSLRGTVPLILVCGGLACGQAAAPEKVQISNTQTLDFPAGGTLHLTNGLGLVTIQGWDDAGVEITTIKSSKTPLANKEERDRMTKLLDSVKITAERRGDEILVASSYRKHPKIMRPFEGMTDFDLEYRIKVPRAAKLTIAEDMGETNIENITGDIHVEINLGQINLLLPDGQYGIDAKCKLGSVTSDFPGTARRQKFVGHAFLASPSTPAQKLFLRTVYGDIVIEKKH